MCVDALRHYHLSVGGFVGLPTRPGSASFHKVMIRSYSTSLQNSLDAILCMYSFNYFITLDYLFVPKIICLLIIKP
jgi:hypothetical protein